MSESSSPPPPYPNLPADLTEAQAQAIEAIQAALAAGYTRLQVEIVAPDLKPEILARPFLDALDRPLAVLFSDAGGAALARRDWQMDPTAEDGLLLQEISTQTQITADQSLLFVIPAVMVVDKVEAICDSVLQKGQQPKPVILLNPQLQDAATVGVGLAGRRLRDRFIRTFEICYYLQALGSGALFRIYPHPWSVWRTRESGEYELVETAATKPTGEELAEILARSGQAGSGFLDGIRRFLRALQR